jgi:PAS domain S-box-containing protein
VQFGADWSERCGPVQLDPSEHLFREFGRILAGWSRCPSTAYRCCAGDYVAFRSNLRSVGYELVECVSRPIIDFVHPEDRERTRAALSVLADGGELCQFENRYICRDGSVSWLQWNCRPGPRADGLVAAAARNITASVRRVEQAALQRVATVVARGAAPGDVFTAVAAEVAHLLDADVTLAATHAGKSSSRRPALSTHRYWPIQKRT